MNLYLLLLLPALSCFFSHLHCPSCLLSSQKNREHFFGHSFLSFVLLSFNSLFCFTLSDFHLLLFHYLLTNKKRGMKDPTVYALPAQIASPSGQGGLSYSTYQKQLRLTRSIVITKRIYQVEKPLLLLLDLSQPVDWDRLGLSCNVSWEHFSSSGKSGSPIFNYSKYLASQICLRSAKEQLYSGFS